MSLGATFLLRPTPAPRPEQRYREALALFRNGDFSGAIAKAHAGWQDEGASGWGWRLRLIEAEGLIARNQSAAARVLLNGGSLSGSEEFQIRRRVLQAGTLEFEDARPLLEEARRLAQVYSRSDLDSEIDQMEARFLTEGREYERARAIWERARHEAEAAQDRYNEAASLNGLGMTWFRQARYEQALGPFQQARELWGGAGAGYKVGVVSNNINMCYAELGDFDNALKYSQEARGLLRPGVSLANALGEAGSTYYLQGDLANAIFYYRKACDMARQFSPGRDAARWTNNLSLALIQSRDWDGAEEALQDALRLGPEKRSLVYFDLNSGRIAAGRNRLPEARTLFERVIAKAAGNPGALWDAYAGLANTWIAEGNTELANRNFDDAIRVIEGSQSDLRGQDHKITFLARLIRFYQDYVDALIAQNQPIKALAVADSSRARVLSQRFDRRLAAAQPHQESEFEAIARQSGSVWLSYWLAPKASLLWVTTPKESRYIPLKVSAAEIANLVEEYRGSLERLHDPMQVPSEAGRRLYDILVAPAAPWIPPGTSVTIVPDGPLYQLSFPSLPVYETARPHYWIEDNAISTALAFSVFRVEKRQPAGMRRSLLIGDTLPEPGFPKLEYSGSELDNAEKHLSGDVPARVTKYVGAEARPEIWQQADPGKFDIIHFAAHAEANGHSPLDSAIILSPGNGFRLPARDIIGTPLHAELVTLSACRSSGARTYAGEGLVGLTWAFLQAGSRNVVAGLWDVADQSTSRLMDRFYTEIAKGVPPADALRTSQLELLHSIYAKPYYWAPFQCYRR